MATTPRPSGYCRNCGKELVGNPEICMGCGARPMSGTSFCPACGGPTNALSAICVKCGAPLGAAVRPASAAAPGAVAGNISPKSRLATTLLAFFLGTIGIHRFYIGQTKTAILMIILGIIGWATIWMLVGVIFIIAVEIWAFVDFIMAIVGKMKDGQGRLIEKW